MAEFFIALRIGSYKEATQKETALAEAIRRLNFLIEISPREQ